MDQIFLDGDFRYFTLQHWIKFVLGALYVFFGLFVAKKSIRVWTRPGNSFWWAVFLFPYTVLARSQWNEEKGIMDSVFAKYGATVRPFFYDILIKDDGEVCSVILETVYYAFHIFFWPLRAFLNLLTAIAAQFVSPVIKELDRKSPV